MRTFQVIGDELIETDTPAVVLARMNSTARPANLISLSPPREYTKSDYYQRLIDTEGTTVSP